MPRPVSVLVLGILHLVFGLMGLCGLGLVLFMFTPAYLEFVGDDVYIEAIRQSNLLWMWQLISGIVGALLAMVLLAAGAALLMERAWGRTLSILWAWGDIAQIVIGLAMHIFVVIPAVLERAQQSQKDADEKIIEIVGLLAGVVGMIAFLAYPIVVLVFMYRPNVVAFFRALEWPPEARPDLSTEF